MSKILFTDAQEKKLSKNKWIKNITNKGITYTDEFKYKLVKECENYKKFPQEVFRECGINPEIVGIIRIQNSAYRWRKQINSIGEIRDTRTTKSGNTLKRDLSDKEKTKLIWQSVGLPVVPYVCIKRSVVLDSIVYDSVIEETEKELGYPMFVKPCCAGSSNGASKAKDRKELNFAIMEAFAWDDKVLVEKSLDGAREIECSVTGNSVSFPPDSDVEEVTAYIPGEIKPNHDFYDFDAKYNDPDGANLIIPAELSENDLEKIRKTACAAYKVLDATGLSCVDFFIDRNSKQVYLNEINTLPGFTPISMFPKMCNAAGLKFEELVELLIKEALARYEAHGKLNTSR